MVNGSERSLSAVVPSSSKVTFPASRRRYGAHFLKPITASRVRTDEASAITRCESRIGWRVSSRRRIQECRQQLTSSTSGLIKASVRQPSLTRAACQHWTGVGPPPNFKPGIASCGWAINGEVLRLTWLFQARLHRQPPNPVYSAGSIAAALERHPQTQDNSAAKVGCSLILYNMSCEKL